MRELLKKILDNPLYIGGIILILCVIFEIHGSSISIYADILEHHELSDIILGKYRSIRTDEYVVFTPFAFSQYFTNFSMISDIVRAAPTNMFMTYGQAVWHPAIIYRPAQIGYLFLDQGSGLAFYWTGRLIALFLVSYKFAEKVLSVDKKFAVIYAIMIAFSPLAQWWWSVNSIAEILAAGQGVVICWKLYLEQEETQKRFLSAILFLWCAGIFIFGIYPAWQVSFGYVFLFLLIAVSFQQSNALKSLWRDKIFWVLGFLIMLAPIAHAFYISQDMIEIQMATEYPGKRFTIGGDWSLSALLMILFAYGTDVILPFKSMSQIFSSTHGMYVNECEAASFFTMAPLGLLMFFYMRFKLKQNDFLMTALFAITILFCVWEISTFPDWLAKISFMSTTTNYRVRSAIDFVQLVMVFRGLTLIKDFPSPFIRLILAEAIAILPVIAIYNFLPDWFNIKKGFSVFAFISLSVFLILSPMNKKSFIALVILMLGIGATINPINKGVDVIYKMPVGQKISEIIQQDKKSFWIVVDDGIVFNDIPIMYGAPTINSVNVYPVLDRWKKLDPEGKDFSIYNRYAHIQINLKNEPTKITVQADVIRLDLRPNDLKILEVKYIFSRQGDLENFSNPNVTIKKIFEDRNSFIYEVN